MTTTNVRPYCASISFQHIFILRKCRCKLYQTVISPTISTTIKRANINFPKVTQQTVHRITRTLRSNQLKYILLPYYVNGLPSDQRLRSNVLPSRSRDLPILLTPRVPGSSRPTLICGSVSTRIMLPQLFFLWPTLICGSAARSPGTRRLGRTSSPAPSPPPLAPSCCS